jgi:hypothetical protein
MNEAMKSSIRTNIFQTLIGLGIAWGCWFFLGFLYVAQVGTAMLVIGNVIFAVRCIKEVRSQKN